MFCQPQACLDTIGMDTFIFHFFTYSEALDLLELIKFGSFLSIKSCEELQTKVFFRVKQNIVNEIQTDLRKEGHLI